MKNEQQKDFKKEYLAAKDNETRASILRNMFHEIEDRFKDSDINNELGRILNKYKIRYNDKENKDNIVEIQNIFGDNSNKLLKLHYDRCYILLTMKKMEIENSDQTK